MSAAEPSIESVHGRQILDSRGRPTVEVEVRLANGASAAPRCLPARRPAPTRPTNCATATRATSTGSASARGQRRARRDRRRTAGPTAARPAGVDALLRDLDGTASLSRLGANAVLGDLAGDVPGRGLKRGEPLYRRIAELAGVDEPTLPMPMVNILSGGLHAGRGMDVQDFLAVPVAPRPCWRRSTLARVRDAAAGCAPNVACRRCSPTRAA